MLKAKIWNGEAEPTPLEGEREPWGGTRCPLKANNKKLEIIPKKSYKIVDKRNYIAHGNKTPKEVGREVSVNDLQRKLDHISEACTYIIELYEEYIEEQLYLKNH